MIYLASWADLTQERYELAKDAKEFVLEADTTSLAAPQVGAVAIHYTAKWLEHLKSQVEAEASQYDSEDSKIVDFRWEGEPWNEVDPKKGRSHQGFVLYGKYLSDGVLSEEHPLASMCIQRIEPFDE